jgi:distribution and morphology protein 34
VVNLRKSRNSGDFVSESGDSVTETESSVADSSESVLPDSITEEPEEELITPPRSPAQRVRFRSRGDSIDLGETPRRIQPQTPSRKIEYESRVAIGASTQEGLAKIMEAPSVPIKDTRPAQPQFLRVQRPTYERRQQIYPVEKSGSPGIGEKSNVPFHYTPAATQLETQNHGIVEQAWMMKMAGELARRVNEKAAISGSWEEQSMRGREETPPPAYEVQ